MSLFPFSEYIGCFKTEGYKVGLCGCMGDMIPCCAVVSLLELKLSVILKLISICADVLWMWLMCTGFR